MAKTYKVTLLSDKDVKLGEIDCPADKYILDAAEDAEFDLPYSCRSGSCSTCVGKVVTGTIEQGDQSFLDKNQIAAGYILTCVSYPKSDVVVKTNQEQYLF
jgi:ferredoxin|uniref:Ferredoxin n=1 Tax=Synura petersenii TaxID=52555 RepID=A0A3G2QYQ3_9STRA|nr:ferredoxin [Synura petersenii]